MGSTFLSEFMMISNINTVLFIVLLIGLFFVINKIKKSLNFTKLMLVSMGMGTILGFIIQYIAKFPKDPTQISWLEEVTTWYGLVGYGFMDLLKMLVIPLVLTSIIRVIMNMNIVRDNIKERQYRLLIRNLRKQEEKNNEKIIIKKVNSHK